jgi:hypothetical protein
MLFPDAMQREALHRRAGIVPISERGTIPGQQRITEEVLRCAREKPRSKSAGITAAVRRVPV